MRTFIAIELPGPIKDSLARLEGRLKKTGADVKWVEPDNIHLTLKFLGEISQEKLNSIYEAMEKACAGKRTFLARISGAGAFPGLNSPRVIWAGVSTGEKQIKEIAKELEEKIQKLGVPKEERAFSSHITIGRARSNLNRDKLTRELTAAQDFFNAENLEFNVEKITLFQSTLTPKGPIYEPLKTADLTTT